MIQRIDQSQPGITPYDRAGRRTVRSAVDAPAFLLGDGDEGVVYERGDRSGASRRNGTGAAPSSERVARQEKSRAATATEERRIATGTGSTSREAGRAEDARIRGTVADAARREAADTSSQAPADEDSAWRLLSDAFGRARSFFSRLFAALWNGTGEGAGSVEGAGEAHTDAASGDGTALDEVATDAVPSGVLSGDADRDSAGADRAAMIPMDRQGSEAAALRDLRDAAARYDDARIRALLARKDDAGFMDALTLGNRRKLARNTTLLTTYDRFGRLVRVDGPSANRILRGEQGSRSTVRRPQGNYRRYI